MEANANPDFSTKHLASEIHYLTTRSSGPGGQHANKTETRVELRWNVFKSNLFSDEAKNRIAEKLSGKITKEGELRVICQESRSQEMNKQIAFQRFTDLLKIALQPEKKRKETKPSRASNDKRLSEKKRQAEKKVRRKPPQA